MINILNFHSTKILDYFKVAYKIQKGERCLFDFYIRLASWSKNLWSYNRLGDFQSTNILTAESLIIIRNVNKIVKEL
jgi:hypothetical protein